MPGLKERIPPDIACQAASLLYRATRSALSPPPVLAYQGACPLRAGLQCVIIMLLVCGQALDAMLITCEPQPGFTCDKMKLERHVV